MMPQITIVRYHGANDGTRGVMVLPTGQRFDTLELPWRDNRPNLSCIPAGSYPCQKVQARRFIGGRRDLYFVADTPGRTGILIHAGTFAGDITKGLRTSVQGCILIGLSAGTYKGQAAVFNTRRAVQELDDAMNGGPFTLTIIGGEHA